MNTPVAQNDQIDPLKRMQQGAVRIMLSSDGELHMGQSDFATFLAALTENGHTDTDALSTPTSGPAPVSETMTALSKPFEKVPHLQEPHTVTRHRNLPAEEDPILHARKFLRPAQENRHPVTSQDLAQLSAVTDPLLPETHAVPPALVADMQLSTSATTPQDRQTDEAPAQADPKRAPQSVIQDGSTLQTGGLAERGKATQGGRDLNSKIDDRPARLLPVTRSPTTNTGEQSARPEIAATALRFSTYPTVDHIATQRLETVSDGSPAEAGTARGLVFQGGTARPASATPSLTGKELFHLSPRTQADSTAPIQMGRNAGGLSNVAVTTYQPEAMASIINGLQTIEPDAKMDATTSVLVSSETSALPSWDTSRMPSTQHTPGAPPRTDIVTYLARQLIEVIAPATNRPIEIALSPQELGRVRMEIATDNGRITVHILAERPDTLDLMRRYIDQLNQSFRSMGYDDVSFSFGQGTAHSDNASTSPHDQQAVAPAGTAVSESDPLPDAPNVIQLDLTATSGVDIRL